MSEHTPWQVEKKAVTMPAFQICSMEQISSLHQPMARATRQWNGFPHRHDDMIAYTSQLAHIVSSAYVKDDCMDDAVSFSGGSFQDMTRVATMDEKMWASLFMDNRLLLLHHLELLIAHLSEYRTALELQDESALQLLIADGRRVQEENVRKRKRALEERAQLLNEAAKEETKKEQNA